MSKFKLSIIILVIICLVFSAFIFFRLRNGVTVSARNRDDISYRITQHRQDNSEYADDFLGNSNFTMKSSGCLTTCISSALSTNNRIFPGELNKLFSSNGVYDKNGNLQWSQLEKLGYKADVLSTVSEDAIYSYLQKGQFPIVRVRVNGFGNFHYVLIVGVKNGEYICMDPLKDNLTTLSDYFNKVYAIRVVH